MFVSVPNVPILCSVFILFKKILFIFILNCGFHKLETELKRKFNCVFCVFNTIEDCDKTF